MVEFVTVFEAPLLSRRVPFDISAGFNWANSEGCGTYGKTASKNSDKLACTFLHGPTKDRSKTIRSRGILPQGPAAVGSVARRTQPEPASARHGANRSGMN